LTELVVSVADSSCVKLPRQAKTSNGVWPFMTSFLPKMIKLQPIGFYHVLA